MSAFLLKPTPHERAAQWIADKTLTRRQVFDGLLPELRGRAFLITGVEDADVLQRVRDLLADVPRGEDWEKTRERIAGEISPFLGEEEADARAELLLRMHVNQAYEAMNWREMEENRDIFPYYEYLTIEDERVRPAHKALHGIIAPAGSSFWKNHWPPWQWGCRCSVRGVQDWEADEIRAKEKNLPPDQRRLLDGAALKKLEGGDLVRGPNKSFDVRTPSERRQPGSYEWHPSTMRIPIETLRDRYDPEVWAEFEAWAKRTKMDARGDSVWDWISKQAATAPETAGSPAGVDVLIDRLDTPKAEWTAGDAGRLFDEIRAKAPTADALRARIQEAIARLPAKVAAALPDRVTGLFSTPRRIEAVLNSPAGRNAAIRALIREILR